MKDRESSYGIRMGFLPDEQVEQALTDMLIPAVVEHMRDTRHGLGFYSINSYIQHDQVSSLEIRRLKKSIDGIEVPFSRNVSCLKWRHPDEADSPAVGMRIKVSADLTGEPGVADTASRLGFANAEGLVDAELRLKSEYLNRGSVHGKSAYERYLTLQRLFCETDLPPQAEVAFIEYKNTT